MDKYFGGKAFLFIFKNEDIWCDNGRELQKLGLAQKFQNTWPKMTAMT